MLKEIVKIARQASSLMTDAHFEINEKDVSENIVTSSDLAVQHFLTERLAALLPGSGFICEEEDFRSPGGEYLWIIDPIDGTANYARGIADCCISVALARYGELECAVVYSPGRGELYTAERGRGAYLNGHPVTVSSRPFGNGLFCTAMSTYRKDMAGACNDIIMDIYMRSNDVRRFGSAALELCLLASGRIELYFEIRLQPWDYAAAMLVLTEAGGVISGFDGCSLPSLYEASTVIAANCPESLSEIAAAVHRRLPARPY